MTPVGLKILHLMKKPCLKMEPVMKTQLYSKKVFCLMTGPEEGHCHTLGGPGRGAHGKVLTAGDL